MNPVERYMRTWHEPSFQNGLPTMMKFCKTCQRETSHQIRTAQGAVVVICVPCLSRALTYEMDRD